MNENVKAILAQLVAFDTTSYKSNLDLIHYIKELLQSYGLEPKLIHDASGKKANLYACLPAQTKGGIILSGHTDVVPVDGQTWTFAPFELTEQDGRYYGRGTTDMKGFIACVLASLPLFLSADLKMPLHLAFSYDEEVGCLGVGHLIDQLKLMDDKPDFCIIGEPTQMQAIYGHKGKVAMRCQIHGHACHSAYAPQGVNAIEYAAKMMNKIISVADGLKATQDKNFDPPFSTMQVGVIRGGSALNIVPQLCEFDFEIRHLPNSKPDIALTEIANYASDILLPEMQAVHQATHIEFSQLSRYPGLLTDVKLPFAQNLAKWSDSKDFSTVAFGTEGGLFQDAGIITLVCGPGNMEQGHKPDEFIAIEQLEKCQTMLTKLHQWLKA
ncbi:acetylornithine deacetylase [Bartonella sp. HY761]|uniref:acetylornithine deacetylase n=1 Tax=Bartonella sp. HY761 TaxID=2979330 RepID=UPI0022052771|nr:acetylornithine deacetylase [Bartonella sp. HY761]UXN07910.1 acetylornithine deacetylase [Bartonella sp. HY761]